MIFNSRRLEERVSLLEANQKELIKAVNRIEEEQEKLKGVVSSALQLNTALSSRMDSLSERIDKISTNKP